MKVHKKRHNRYIKMQEGGLGEFRGMSRYKRGGGGMFGMLAQSARSILPQVEKELFKAVAPGLLDEGIQLLTRKKDVKQAVKSVAKCSKSNVINTGKEALRQEIARYQKGGGLINTKARQTGRLKRR